MIDSGTLVLNKLDYDYMNSKYKVSTQKLCSTYISVDSKTLPTYTPCLIQCILKYMVYLPVFEISAVSFSTRSVISAAVLNNLRYLSIG